MPAQKSLRSARERNAARTPESQDGRRRDTRAQILDVAENLVQTRGFNGFSYADVAAQVGVTTASLHYHFPGKNRLGEALIERWTSRHMSALAAIETKHATAPARLAAYADLYSGVSRGKRLGLCGMLAAEHQTLPPRMRELVATFLTANQDWLERVLDAGRDDSGLAFEGSARDAALVILAGIQGASLVARPHRDADCFRTVARSLLAAVAREPQRRVKNRS